MLRYTVLFIALWGAGPVAALSCLRPEIAGSFRAADERPEDFVIALGALTRVGEDVPNGPDTGDPNMRVGYQFTARFDGRFASRDAFVIDRVVNVTVEVACVSAWCGSDSLSGYGLYFFRRDHSGGYAFESGPCPIFHFDHPSEHQLMEVIGLMQ